MASTSPAEWTATTLTTLIHAVALSPSDAASLLPHSAAEITSMLRKISSTLNNPPSWTTPRHTRAVLKRVTGLSPPPKPRKKKLPTIPKHRISLQLIPATPADDAAVRAAGAYPFVEVVLKAGRRVWDVVKHLYQKWGLPVNVQLDRNVVSVDSLVVQLVESGSRSVRLPYRVLNVNIDWSVLNPVLDHRVTVQGKRRVVAPRDEEAFWTGLLNLDAKRSPSGGDCRVQGQRKASGNGEQAVLSRLRGHLEKLDRSGDGVQNGKEVQVGRDDVEDPAIIPERFLRSCSRFEFAHSLPDSLLSLGKSDGSGDENGGGGAGAGGDSANPLQVMNDALDLRHEIDLRCDEQLDGDFLHPVLNVSPPPSLGLSALFDE